MVICDFTWSITDRGFSGSEAVHVSSGRPCRKVIVRHRRILRVYASLLKIVTVALFPLLKISFFSRFDVLHVDLNEVVSVWPGMLVHKAEGVEKLVDRGHQAHLETATETGTFERK